MKDRGASRPLVGRPPFMSVAALGALASFMACSSPKARSPADATSLTGGRSGNAGAEGVGGGAGAKESTGGASGAGGTGWGGLSGSGGGNGSGSGGTSGAAGNDGAMAKDCGRDDGNRADVAQCLCDAINRCTPSFGVRYLSLGSERYRVCGARGDQCVIAAFREMEGGATGYSCLVPTGANPCTGGHPSVDQLMASCTKAFQCNILLGDCPVGVQNTEMIPCPPP